MSLHQRRVLWKLLERSVETESGCWNWNGYTRSDGYGQMTHAGDTDGAHRWAYRVFYGDIPSRMMICHRCDNPLCVNPSHLFAGTAKDNYDDSRMKGRQPVVSVGEQNPQARLTTLEVIQIRDAKGTMREIASRYGVSAQTVSLIKRRKRWACVA